jgi:hypothetical protein
LHSLPSIANGNRHFIARSAVIRRAAKSQSGKKSSRHPPSAVRWSSRGPGFSAIPADGTRRVPATFLARLRLCSSPDAVIGVLDGMASEVSVGFDLGVTTRAADTEGAQEVVPTCTLRELSIVDCRAFPGTQTEIQRWPDDYPSPLQHSPSGVDPLPRRNRPGVGKPASGLFHAECCTSAAPVLHQRDFRPRPKRKALRNSVLRKALLSRGDWIRTSDLLTPSQTRYPGCATPRGNLGNVGTAGRILCDMPKGNLPIPLPPARFDFSSITDLATCCNRMPSWEVIW